ncbi:DUF706-domain-containing protein [Mycena galericulata]|nr:DUF706-domain-containing protein [Mycena galericulata]
MLTLTTTPSLKGQVWDKSSQFDAVPPVGSGVRPRKAAWYGSHPLPPEKQTVEFNIKMRPNMRKRIWEAMEKFNTLIDDSDPDTDLSQIEHLLQTAEAIRRDGKPDRMQVTGGGQWDVVGVSYEHRFDKPGLIFLAGYFVIGCAFSNKTVLPESFAGNPDSQDAVYSTEYRIYNPNCGLENVMLSWDHDEYEGLATIRYHSFYPTARARTPHLTNASDEKALAAARSDEAVDPGAPKPYYEHFLLSSYLDRCEFWYLLILK